MDFDDPASLSLDTSTLLSPLHSFTSPGNYSVTAIVYGCATSDTIIRSIDIYSYPEITTLADDTILCEGDVLTLTTDAGYDQYLWSTNSTQNSILANTTGKYWVRITDNGCISSDTVNVAYAPYPELELGNDTVFCIATEYLLNPDNNLSGQYLWSEGSVTADLQISASGKYWVQAGNAHCESSDTILVVFEDNKTLTAFAVPEVAYPSEPIQFTALENTFAQYEWNFADGSSSNIQNPVHHFAESGNYQVTVTATTENQCELIRTTPVVIKELLYIPNLFTPNHDLLNDSFEIIYIGSKTYQLKIYDRWGKQVYVSNDRTMLWNGEDAASGVYYYTLAIGPDTHKGWVHLMR